MISFTNCTITDLSIFRDFFKSKSCLPYPELSLFKMVIELVLYAGNFKISEFKLIIKPRNSFACMRH